MYLVLTFAKDLLRSKKKKERQRQKREGFKAETIKSCHQGQNIIVLAILERLESENVSCRPIMVADNTFHLVFHGSPTLKSISPAL